MNKELQDVLLNYMTGESDYHDLTIELYDLFSKGIITEKDMEIILGIT